VKTFWKVAGIATLVAIVGVLLIGAVALAQDPEDGADWPFDFREKLHQAIADALGIGVDEYDAALETAHDRVLDQAVAEGFLSQEQADQMRERAAEGFGPGMMGGGFFGPGSRSGAWGRGGHGIMGRAETSLIAVAAQAMDMTTEELLAELQDGKSIADVAAERGTDVQAIADAYVAERAAWLDELVAAERMTQAQADSMLAHMEEGVLEHLSEPYPFGGRGPGGCEGEMPGGTWRGGPRFMPGRFPGQGES
jgi:hypothetical protein